MKTLILIFLLATSFAFSQDSMSYAYSAKQQAALDIITARANAQNKVIWDSDEAAKKSANPAYVVLPYIPLTAKQYFKGSMDAVINSYVDQVDADDLKTLTDAYKAANSAKRAAAKTALQ